MVRQTPEEVIRIYVDIPAETFPSELTLGARIIDLIGGDQGSLWQGKEQGVKSWVAQRLSKR